MDDTSWSNIKEYIVECRKKGTVDSTIIENLNKSSWPQDIISKAMQQANEIISAVPEIQEEIAQELIKVDNNIIESQSEIKTKNNDLFTQPPSEIYENNLQKVDIKKEKKKFSIMTLIALLVSPIPFIGLYFAMMTLDSCKKKNMSGGFLAVFAILINTAVILFIIYVMFQLFTMDIDKMTGFAKFINDQFGLV